MFSCVHINTTEAFEALRGEWDALAARTPDATIFGLFGFSFAWWRAHARDHELHVIALRETSTGQLILVAPFCAEKKFPKTWRTLGHPGADYCGVLFNENYPASIAALEDWLKTNAIWNRIEIHSVQKSDWLLKLGKTLSSDESQDKKFRTILAGPWPVLYRAWTENHPFMNQEKLVEHRAVLSKPSYKRHINWFERIGKLRHETLRDETAISDALATFVSLHHRRWSGEKDQVVYPADGAFLHVLVKELAPHQCIRLDLLWLGDKWIAAHFGFQWRNRFYWYLPAYEPAMATHGPGRLLLGYILANAEKDHVHELDFLRGLEDYKKQYCSEIRQTARVSVFRDWKGAALHFIENRRKAA